MAGGANMASLEAEIETCMNSHGGHPPSESAESYAVTWRPMPSGPRPLGAIGREFESLRADHLSHIILNEIPAGMPALRGGIRHIKVRSTVLKDGRYQNKKRLRRFSQSGAGN